jgi:hypothetical protein
VTKKTNFGTGVSSDICIPEKATPFFDRHQDNAAHAFLSPRAAAFGGGSARRLSNDSNGG